MHLVLVQDAGHTCNGQAMQNVGQVTGKKRSNCKNKSSVGGGGSGGGAPTTTTSSSSSSNVGGAGTQPTTTVPPPRVVNESESDDESVSEVKSTPLISRRSVGRRRAAIMRSGGRPIAIVLGRAVK